MFQDFEPVTVCTGVMRPFPSVFLRSPASISGRVEKDNSKEKKHNIYLAELRKIILFNNLYQNRGHLGKEGKGFADTLLGIFQVALPIVMIIIKKNNKPGSSVYLSHSVPGAISPISETKLWSSLNLASLKKSFIVK